MEKFAMVLMTMLGVFIVDLIKSFSSLGKVGIIFFLFCFQWKKQVAWIESLCKYAPQKIILWFI